MIRDSLSLAFVHAYTPEAFQRSVQTFCALASWLNSGELAGKPGEAVCPSDTLIMASSTTANRS